MNIDAVYVYGDYSVIFTEMNNKARSENLSIIDIIVLMNDEIISKYIKEIKRPVNQIHYQKFIAKFFNNLEYRNSYLIDGCWDKVLEFNTHRKIDKVEKKLDERCREYIQKLNDTPMQELSFRDFANLKTFGYDYISNLPEEEMINALETSLVDDLRTSFMEDDKLFIQSLRWCMRGLHIDKAIRKVKVDKEIDNKKKQRIETE